MRAASFLSSSDHDRSALRRRAVSLLLTILAHVLLLVMLLRLAPVEVRLPGAINRLITFNVLPEARTERKTIKASATSARHRSSAAVIPPRAAPPTIFKNAPTPWVLTPGLEKYDIRQAPVTRPAEPQPDEPSPPSEEDSAYTGGSGKAVYGPSQNGSVGGGGGERLYYAEWYREPTSAELSYYLPKENRQPGYGEVACQTIEKFHVDNCRELGESPAGTGLARAVRQAAWQFLVRPPHVGGRSLVGAWVRIRITYTEGGAEAERRRRR
ncbi:MAG TPA: hypothetical protein VNT42_00995 [Sphingomonas sp.]|nr:hypothetical protein [Sphingomonas sp.]